MYCVKHSKFTLHFHNKQKLLKYSRFHYVKIFCKLDLLHEGDELLSVNGIELMGKDLNTVCDIMVSNFIHNTFMQ